MNAPIKTPKAGDNKPALITADQLAIDFAYLEQAIAKALAVAADAPSVIEDDDDIEACREAVKALMAEHKRAEALRVDVKAPYLDAERVVDSYFAALKKRLADCQAKIESAAKRYLDKKAVAERERREAEARAARDAERKAQEAREAAERAAAEERRKADDAARAAAKADADKRAEAERAAHAARAEAEAREAQAKAARQAELSAAATATQAERSADEKPADLARTRVGDGMATLQQYWDFKIEAYADIDLEALRPYFAEADVEKAIRRYVAINKDSKPLRGVSIYPSTRAQMR